PDPAWTADGHVSVKWLPVSPVTGRLDAFQWRVPLAELSSPDRFIDEEVPAVVTDVAAEPAAPTAPAGAPAAAAASASVADDDDDDAPAYDGSPHAGARAASPSPAEAATHASQSPSAPASRPVSLPAAPPRR